MLSSTPLVVLVKPGVTALKKLSHNKPYKFFFVTSNAIFIRDFDGSAMHPKPVCSPVFHLSFYFYVYVHTLHVVHWWLFLNIMLLSSCNTASCTCNASNFGNAHGMCYAFSVMLSVRLNILFLCLNKSFGNVPKTFSMI